MQTQYVPGKGKFDSARRKYNQALRVFNDVPDFVLGETFVEFRPVKRSVEFTTYFYYKTEKYRLDYEINLEEKLPYVRDIRTLLWESLQDYRRQIQQRGYVGGSA